MLNADLALSNFPKTPAIVPLLDELVGQLLDRNRAHVSAPCGEPLVVHLPAEAGSAAGLRIVGPEGAEAAVSGGSFGELTDGDVGVTWYWPAPDRPGAYQVKRDQETVSSLAVAIPAEESHLDRLKPEVLRSARRGVSVVLPQRDGNRRPSPGCWLVLTPRQRCATPVLTQKCSRGTSPTQANGLLERGVISGAHAARIPWKRGTAK